MDKKCKWCKNAMQNKYKFKKKNVSSKTRIPENDFGHPLDSHLGGVQDMQSRLPGFHAFRFLNLPHIQYVQAWVSVRFGFLSLHQLLTGHIDFQERVGGWHSPPAQVPNAAFRESGTHFQWMTLPTVHLFRFFAFILFLLLLLLWYCCCIVVVLFLYCFLIVFVLFFIVS